MPLRIREDIAMVFARDPAARGVVEVLLCTPGLHALWGHRIAHRLWQSRLRLFARVLSTLVRGWSGVDIHPAATIGRRVFIDHGMGVVIGETAEIGDDCVLYQGVTLGGVSLAKDKRHPSIEDHVVLGAGAKILGPIRVGKGARVGANSVVVQDVRPGAIVVGIPAREVNRRDPEAAERIELHHERIVDPTTPALADLFARVDRLERAAATPPAEKRG